MPDPLVRCNSLQRPKIDGVQTPGVSRLAGTLDVSVLACWLQWKQELSCFRTVITLYITCADYIYSARDFLCFTLLLFSASVYFLQQPKQGLNLLRGEALADFGLVLEDFRPELL